jgi:hypothetical protein
VSRRIPSAVAAGIAAAALAPLAAADPPALYVVFHSDHTFLVSLGSGQVVGTTSGTASVIPAGTYKLLVDDTSDTDALFDLAGPGVKLVTDMTHGEDSSAAFVETFLPSSTYTYRDDMRPGVVWTFVTSSDTTGSTTTGTTPSGSTSNGKTSSSDIVGSGVAASRGTLAGAVGATGKVALSRNGKPVRSLKEGRYTVAVVDGSKALGFALRGLRRRPITVTTGAFVGRRALTVSLEPGRWFAYSSGTRTITFTVTT